MQAPNKSKLNISISWHYICIALLLTNVLTVFLWKPWQDSTATTRKITMSGEATIKAEPDEYVLNPYFEYTNVDRAKATQELTTQGAAVTAKLKELGVKDEQIKSNTNGYDKYYSSGQDSGENTMQLTYTITVSDKELAQKVQDYLLTLNPQGQISPMAQFSETKQKDLETEAREKAIDDARAKAEKTATQLKAKVGKVVSVSDGVGYGGGMPIPYAAGAMEVRSDSAISSLPIQVGQNEFTYAVTVEYELK